MRELSRNLIRRVAFGVVTAGLFLAMPQPACAQPAPEATNWSEQCLMAQEQGSVETMEEKPIDIDLAGPRVDGRVDNLNQSCFAVLTTSKRKNPVLSKQDAVELKATMQADHHLDSAELDLLSELLQTSTRTISVSELGNPHNTIVVGSTFGEAREILLDALCDQATLEAEWTKGEEGYLNLVTMLKEAPARQSIIVNFLEQKLRVFWQQSNTANAYGPIAQQLTAMNKWAKHAKQDIPLARSILHNAMWQVDRDESDAVPDFLYNWIR